MENELPMNSRDEVQPGQRIAAIEAMKMEAPITNTSAGILTTRTLTDR
jgi:biotin carboxyl carrier protein